MSLSASAAYCINPECPHPYPQNADNKYCNGCGTSLRLNNRYIPIARLGSGGFAVIYTVWDLQANIEKVLKVLIDTAPKALELFEQEAAVLERLKHPGIPNVEEGSYFLLNIGNPPQRCISCLVMEKIAGQTLEDVLIHYPQGCPEALVQSWLIQAIEILEELHKQNIIHRDIKPSNLMLRQNTNQLVAIDFGGAKQISTVQVGSQGSSTRLFSPGYSPPEQVTGGGVGVTTDFYALGKTMIHLLTGVYPPDLEDPLTGELRWRDRISVSPSFADLLDEMVQIDISRRPANVAIIKERLLPNSTARSNSSNSSQTVQFSLKLFFKNLKQLIRSISLLSKSTIKVTLLIVEAIAKILFACLDTIWEMIAGALGAFVGTTTGFLLAYWLPIGKHLNEFIAQSLPASNPEMALGSQILLFIFAGLGTIWGLTEARGFNQRPRFFRSGLMGILSYGILAILGSSAAYYGGITGLFVLIVFSVAILIAGMGLPSHKFIHAIFSGCGTATVLLTINNFSNNSLYRSFADPTNIWSGWLGSITFFIILSIIIAFWLGISYYIIVPFMRLLGWR